MADTHHMFLLPTCSNAAQMQPIVRLFSLPHTHTPRFPPTQSHTHCFPKPPRKGSYLL